MYALRMTCLSLREAYHSTFAFCEGVLINRNRQAMVLDYTIFIFISSWSSWAMWQKLMSTECRRVEFWGQTSRLKQLFPGNIHSRISTQLSTFNSISSHQHILISSTQLWILPNQLLQVYLYLNHPQRYLDLFILQLSEHKDCSFSSIQLSLNDLSCFSIWILTVYLLDKWVQLLLITVECPIRCYDYFGSSNDQLDSSPWAVCHLNSFSKPSLHITKLWAFNSQCWQSYDQV